MQLMQSKTLLGLVVLLALAAGLALAGKLTPEMVDVIKWVGGAYMAVRATANYAENMSAKSAENKDADR